MKLKVNATVESMTVDRYQKVKLVLDKVIDIHVGDKCKIEIEL